MKKRTVIAISLAGFVLLFVLVWRFTIDGAVASAIEYYGSEALGTDVSVARVTINTAQGKGTIRGLRVAQPEGFGSSAAISFEEITVDFDVNSLVSGDPFVIEFVRVAAPEVVYVVNKQGRNNLSVLSANLDRYSASDAAEPPPDEDAADMLIRIDHLEVERGRIEADLAQLGLGQVEAKLPSMVADNVGGSKGQPPGDLAVTLGGRFLRQATLAVTASSIGSTLKLPVETGTKALRGVFDSLRGR